MNIKGFSVFRAMKEKASGRPQESFSIKIDRISAEGAGIGKNQDGKICFVPYTIPGDIAEVRLVRKKSQFNECRLVQISEPSEQRLAPFCKHFGSCGGCKFQNWDYHYQSNHKQQVVSDALRRIGGLEHIEVEPILCPEQTRAYRNKLEFTFTDRRWLSYEEMDSGEKFDRRGLGFHVPGAFDQVIHLSECHLMDSPAGEIREFIFNKAIELNLPFYNLRNHEGLLRTLMLRRSVEGRMMVLLSFAKNEPALIEEMMKAIDQKFPDLESLLYVINDKKNDTISDRAVHVFSGKAYLTETLGKNQFRITPKSFFQTNTRQAETLYEVVKNYAGLSGKEHVYDLYSGVGSIGIYLSSWCKKVTGIEQIPEAVEDAGLNASINHADHCAFFTGDVKLLLDEKFLLERGKPDVIVTDPPRAGMHEDVVKTLCESAVPRIVYVSCNPATLARDLSMMSERYEIIKVQPIDMFPHTPHIESVALLIKK